MQRVDGSLEALSESLLLQFGFGLVLVTQLLSLRLVGFKRGNFGSQTVDLSLQQRVISCEAINLSLQR
jgi:hypothetical protein